MKISEPIDDWLSSLARELDDSEFSVRLQQELRDHVSDASYDDQLAGVNPKLANEKNLARLGDKNLISTHYHFAMQQRSMLHLYLQALFISILSVAVVTVVFSSLMQLLTYLSFALSNTIITLIILVLVVILSLSVVYVVTLYPIYLGLSGRSHWHWLGIIVTLLNMPLWYFGLTFFFGMDQLGSHGLIILGVIFGFAVVVYMITIVFQYYRYHEKKYGLKPPRVISAAPIFYGLIITFILVSGALQYLGSASNSPLLQIRLATEAVLFNSLPVLMTLGIDHVYSVTRILNIFAIEAGIILVVTGYAFYQVVYYLYYRKSKREKSFPWLWITIIIYIGSIILLPPPSPQLAWQVPARALTPSLEQPLSGPLYPLVNYYTRTSGWLNYNLKTESAGFAIQQNTGIEYHLSNLSEKQGYTLTKTYFSALKFSGYDADRRPVAMQCVRGSHDDRTQWNTIDAADNKCAKLLWNNHVLYTTTDTTPPFIDMMVTTPDEHWGVLMLSANNRSHLYLLDLSALY